MRLLRPASILTALFVTAFVCPPIGSGYALATGSGLQDAAAHSAEPTVQEAYVVMRDMGLAYENVEIRTIVPNEEGISALVGLSGGTLVDVVMTPTASGWTLRDLYYVAGNADEFNAWSGPWRARVADAERFLAAASGGDEPRRRAEELAPLVWFDDLDQSDRLWGMNPTTYRIMQTLKMMPNLSGPMGGGGGNR